MPAPPQLPAPTYELTLDGVAIGHGTDQNGMTGVTVIVCPEGATAAAEVRGTATSTRQFDSLVRAHHLGARAHAVVLAGGSGYGLGCADAVADWLERRGHGLDTGTRRVPVVPTAILFDLGFGDPRAAPSRELAAAAVDAAGRGEVASGSVGAGTGATVGKALGRESAMKGGFGFVSLRGPTGVTVAAAVAVNAFGDVRDPDTGRIVAGCRQGGELVGADRVMAALAPGSRHPWEGNTTLAVVVTDARLAKNEARKTAEMAFGGLYRSLLPAVSLYDGDLVVTLATGRVAAHVHTVGVLAARAVELAVVRAVTEADGFGLLPAVRDLR